MGNLYHKTCFTCFMCKKVQNEKEFFAKDGNPYCEKHFNNTLEKCFTRKKPTTERKLMALGKAYHPNCFTCSVCKNSLDGQPFVCDQQNQVYCVTDYYKKFAVKCYACKQAIVPQNGQKEAIKVVALDHSYHALCLECEHCKTLLSETNPCYPLNGQVLCTNCNAKSSKTIVNYIIKV